MEKKMKDFDRNIEQLMNEHEVAPPFGMWNRIAAELETGVVSSPVSVTSPIPQRAVIGFIVGAIFIGASLVTAYVVNSNSKMETPVTTVAYQTTNVIAPVIFKSESVVKREIKLVAHVSKPKTVAKAVEEPTVIEESTANQVLVSSSEVSIPTQTIAENNAVNEPYYFPAVDNMSENKVAEKTVAPTKAIAKPTDDNDKESVSNNDPPKIRFRPKKHGKFGYMKINRRR